MSKAEFWTKMREKTGLTRVGEPWTSDEETRILSNIAQGKTHLEISTELQRTVSSIQSRLKQMAVEMAQRSIPFEQIKTITTITEEQIKDYVEKKASYKEKPKEVKEMNVHEIITKSDFMEMKCLLYEIRDLLKHK